jgi:hypothetical protein
MNEAPGLPLTVGLMGELVKNNGLGREMAAEGFKGPALDPSTKGQDAKQQGPSFAVGSMGWVGWLQRLAMLLCQLNGYRGGCGK